MILAMMPMVDALLTPGYIHVLFLRWKPSNSLQIPVFDNGVPFLGKSQTLSTLLTQIKLLADSYMEAPSKLYQLLWLHFLLSISQAFVASSSVTWWASPHLPGLERDRGAAAQERLPEFQSPLATVNVLSLNTPTGFNWDISTASFFFKNISML